MDKEDGARIALAVVLSVIGAIAVTKAGIDPRDGILRWLVFSVAAGVVINTQDGKPLKFLIAASALVSFGFILTLLFLALLGEGVIPAMSGVRVDMVNRPLYGSTLLMAIWFGSSIGVLVCSLSRPVTLRLLRNVLAIKLKEAQRVEKLLRLFVAISGAAALLLYSVF